MATITQIDLAQFTGTTGYTKHWTGRLLFTDGVIFLASRAEAFWLLDAIASYHRTEHFQIWELHKHEDNSATLTMKEDTDEPILVKQEIPFTDFPLDSIKLFEIDGVLLLPSEY